MFSLRIFTNHSWEYTVYPENGPVYLRFGLHDSRRN
jgi:hypothetical protein